MQLVRLSEILTKNHCVGFLLRGGGGGVGVGISENTLKHEQDRRGQKKRKGYFAWVLF